ncbi:tRNA (guanosine(18)-2'-O)-methyltransferase [bioreactor metagenome]|uniref:tRNA (Guanosine(18)-2'-O)-methyltransferase n=1 Tax=bioreactor metagenome TaxID=1076179 RepID=A0A644UA65_9ZZZZ|nr:TrmH family RNA methyltransferase [Candidatus Elulimicrobiales bacterium]
MKVVILDNIRSSLNVGSIFRTSSGIGVNKIYLCGITPTPFESSKKYEGQNKKRKDFVKTSLGAEDEINWEYRENILEVIKGLKKDNFEIISLEQDKRSIDYKKLKTEREKVALIIGSETDGIQKEVLDLSDKIVEIPMLGLKESLNVTIAFAILAYKLWDK